MTAPRRTRSRWRWRGSSAANCCRPPRPRNCCRPWPRPRPARRASGPRSAPGWKWSHKTGTGQNFQGRVGGINDIGILTAPDGAALCDGDHDRAQQDRWRVAELMTIVVTRAVIAAHELSRGPATALLIERVAGGLRAQAPAERSAGARRRPRQGAGGRRECCTGSRESAARARGVRHRAPRASPRTRPR